MWDLFILNLFAQVLRLLLVAWDRRLIFSVGTSSTTGESDTVIWNEVHHKTEFGSNLTGHGYPDPGHLDNVLEELRAQGITEEECLPRDWVEAINTRRDAGKTSLECANTQRWEFSDRSEQMECNFSCRQNCSQKLCRNSFSFLRLHESVLSVLMQWDIWGHCAHTSQY